MSKRDAMRWVFTLPILALAVAETQADWSITDFARTATDSAQTRLLYGIRTVGNPASATAASVRSDTGGNFLRFDASKIASDSTEGYSANVGVILPLKPDGLGRNLKQLRSIRFEYRHSEPITEELSVMLGSDAVNASLESYGAVYLYGVSGSTLKEVSRWKTVEIPIVDFSTPKWFLIPVDYPFIEDVLANLRSIRFSPQTQYGSDGTAGGSVCTKCVGPTMAKQVLDIRKVELLGLPGEPPLAGKEPEIAPPVEDLDTGIVAPPPPPPPDTTGHLLSAYSVPELDSAKVNARYGIQAAANPASQVSAVVFDGFVRLQAPRIASEPGHKGYSAYVGLIHPIVPEWRTVDVSKLTSLNFEFRNTNKITDKLLVAFGSEAYTRTQQYSGTIYQQELSSAAKMSPGIQWKSVSLDVLDFATPGWWTPPADFPMLDSVLRVVHSIQFVPQSRYVGDGVEGNRACSRCVGPDMTEQTLDIRNIRLIGVTLPATSKTLERRGDAGFAVSFAKGALVMTSFDGVGQVEIRDLQGRTVASFAAASRVPLQLCKGTYLLTARRGAVPLVRSFAVMGR